MADNTREPGADLPEPTSTGRVISLKECQEHVREDDCWLVINGKVLDVTDFMDEHPGGLDILLQSTGKDASQDFEDINHSATAHKLLDKYAIGDFEGGAPVPKKPVNAVRAQELPASSDSGLFRIAKFLLPVLVIVAAFYLSKFVSS